MAGVTDGIPPYARSVPDITQQARRTVYHLTLGQYRTPLSNRVGRHTVQSRARALHSRVRCPGSIIGQLSTAHCIGYV
eukprot:622347-Rhodomonas_salina.9